MDACRRSLVAARRKVRRVAFTLVAIAAALLALAAVGMPLVGFLGVALVVPAAFAPKVLRDLAHVSSALDGTHSAVEVTCRVIRTGKLPGVGMIYNVWADLYEPGAPAPIVTVAVGAAMSGVPSKQRAITLPDRAPCEAIGPLAVGEWLVILSAEGCILPSGPCITAGGTAR